ncbi:MAG TPA: DUF4349 domain-containing protein [Candidatus Limnocylindrales bacterium]|nr:DUF4349 domain-containing protein [Candidatus Limnocylindrales bacterium]
MRPRRLLPLLGLALILTAACASAGTTASIPPGEAREGGAFGVGQTTDAVAGDKALGAPNGVPAPAGIPTIANATRDLIITANIAMRSNDPWASADAARQIAANLGGDIVALSQSGSGDQRSASLTMRVPSNRVDDALNQIKKLDGEVLTSNVSAKDVTDQLVDLNARLVAKQAEEQRYVQLFAQAKTVDEMLRVDGALANTRMQIEQLQAQLKNTKDHVDFSTISMSVTPLVPSIGEPTGTWDPSRTFAKAFATLGLLFRGIADLAIWGLVFIWIPIIGLAFTALAMRLRRPAPAA